MKSPAINSRFCMALVAVLGISISFPAVPTSNAQQAPRASEKPLAQKDVSATQASAGEEKFKQNCSRCHKAPQELPSHIAGTILRHMRVRASLSQKDERDILKFLNP